MCVVYYSSIFVSSHVYSDLPSHIFVAWTLLVVFYRHFGQMSKMFFVLLPELFFMLSLFGYLAFMVVYKWIAYTPAQSKIAPSILIHFIDMFLFTDNADNPPLYEGQVCRVLAASTKNKLGFQLMCILYIN